MISAKISCGHDGQESLELRSIRSEEATTTGSFETFTSFILYDLVTHLGSSTRAYRGITVSTSHAAQLVKCTQLSQTPLPRHWHGLNYFVECALKQWYRRAYAKDMPLHAIVDDVGLAEGLLELLLQWGNQIVQPTRLSFPQHVCHFHLTISSPKQTL